MIHDEICTSDRKNVIYILPWKCLQFHIVITANFGMAVTEIKQHCKLYILSKNIIEAKTLWTRQSLHSTPCLTSGGKEFAWSFYNEAIKTEYKTVFLLAQIWTQRPLGFSLKSYMYITLLGKTPFKILSWSTCNYIRFSCCFRCVRKIASSDYYLRYICPSVCLPVRPDGTTLFPLDGVSLSFILQYFSKICPENSSFIKNNKKNGYFTWRESYIYRHILLISS
jgi:hypothetical protein